MKIPIECRELIRFFGITIDPEYRLAGYRYTLEHALDLYGQPTLALHDS
jgi:hypothetical protein